MIKEAWDSFKDNIKERITNPFLGTFVLVWIVHNWKIVYAFFYFDKDWKLGTKINYFLNYWNENSFVGNLFIVALITICVLIVTYLFLAISRFLANCFENVIIPLISKLSKGKIYTAEQYAEVIERNLRLEEKLEMERQAKNEALQERDEIEKKYNQKPIQLTNTNLKFTENDYQRVMDLISSKIDKLELDKTILGISKGYSFGSTDKAIDLLIKYGLIELSSRTNSQFYYKFTSIGDEFKKFFFKSEK